MESYKKYIILALLCLGILFEFLKTLTDRPALHNNSHPDSMKYAVDIKNLADPSTVRAGRGAKNLRIRTPPKNLAIPPRGELKRTSINPSLHAQAKGDATDKANKAPKKNKSPKKVVKAKRTETQHNAPLLLSQSEKDRSLSGNNGLPASTNSDFLLGFSRSQILPTQFNPSEGKDPNERTVEQWKNLLLDQPSNENVDQLIEYYRAGKIPPKDFYDIAANLWQHDQEEVRRLAIRALGATPSLESLTALTLIEGDLSTDSPHRSEIIKFLPQYVEPFRLGILKQALGADQAPAVQIKAAQLFSDQVKLFAKQRSQNIDSKKQADYLKSLLEFEPILKKLAGPDPAVQQAASDALELLSHLLTS